MYVTKEFAVGLLCLAVFAGAMFTTFQEGIGAYTATGAMLGVLALFWFGGGVTGHGSL